jgi:hypothetical protein
MYRKFDVTGNLILHSALFSASKHSESVYNMQNIVADNNLVLHKQHVPNNNSGLPVSQA